MALVFYKQAVKKLLLLDICKYFIIYTFSRPMSFIIRAGSRASWLQRVVLVKVCFKSPIFDLVVGGHNSVILDRRSHRRCSVKKNVLRNFAKSSEKHPCQSLFLIKWQALWHSCFPVTFTKFLRTSFLQKISGRLLLIRAPKFQKL